MISVDSYIGSFTCPRNWNNKSMFPLGNSTCCKEILNSLVTAGAMLAAVPGGGGGGEEDPLGFLKNPLQCEGGTPVREG